MAHIELYFRSSEIKRKTMVNVILPDIAKASERPYKTLYLLHGLSDNHNAWINNSNIESYAAKYGIAVVMPDVGRSWYTDTLWGENYFTYLTEELPEVCCHYFGGLSREREYNYVAGLSMGGYGAMKAAMWCPEKYAGIISLSGSLDITRKNRPCDLTLWKAIFDHNMESPMELEGTRFDLYHMASENKKNGVDFPKMFLWCGTEDRLINVNREFSAHLEKLGVEHTYRESEGDHSWKWWDLHIRDGLEFLFGDSNGNN